MIFQQQQEHLQQESQPIRKSQSIADGQVGEAMEQPQFNQRMFTDVNQQEQPQQDRQQGDQPKPRKGKTIRFQILVSFFTKVMSLHGANRSDFVKKWVKKVFEKNRDCQFTYSILRLLLPSVDNVQGRGNYGIKQRALAKIAKITFNLNKDQYQRLNHYKDPSYHPKGNGIGDFPLCMHEQIARLCQFHSQLTVSRLNQLLDDLANASHIDDQVVVFRTLSKISNAEEIKWITRIILKDLKLSIKTAHVLNAYHSDANQYFNLTTSLKQVCRKFEDPSVKLSNEVSIFHPIRPMLAGKKKMDFFSQYQTRKYFSEVKYDGQRIQAHVNKDEVKIYSRNAVDYTHTYGSLIPYLQKNVEADSCILDGELIVVNKKTFEVQPFGMNKCVAQDKQADMQLCYKVFDLLWLKVQGQEVNLMGYPLEQRKQLLEKTLTPEPGKLEVVAYKVLESYEDILKEFNQCIERNEEGLMLKDPDSIYSPKERGQSWLKLKGEYVEGLSDTLDLIIMGGYFGTNSYRVGSGPHWTERITCFLLGLIVSIDKENEKIAYAMPFCKVGTGYSEEDLATLRGRLKSNLIKNDNNYTPQFMNHPSCKWKPKLEDKPDFFVNYLCNSFLLEVRASELIESTSFTAGNTLRFPRCVKVRYDKDWTEAMTRADLEDLKNSEMRNIKRRKQGSDSEDQGKKDKDEDRVSKRRKLDFSKKPKDEIMLENQCVDIKGLQKKSYIFHGMEFNVLGIDNFANRGSGFTKHEIERQILLNNGFVVQNPLETTQYIVCEKEDFKTRLLLQNEKGKEFKFVKPNWIFNCAKRQVLLPLSPIYLAVVPYSKREYYKNSFDKFGDSFTDHLDLQELDQILASMSTPDALKKYHHHSQGRLNEQLMERIRPRKRRSGKVSYCINIDKMMILKLKGIGNMIVTKLSDNPNSIIINDEDDENFQNQKKQIDAYIRSHPEKNIFVEYVRDLKMELTL